VKGVAQRQLLLKHGLGDTLLEDLRLAVDELDASVEETVAGKQRHILVRGPRPTSAALSNPAQEPGARF
jgi:hypothetical protein